MKPTRSTPIAKKNVTLKQDMHLLRASIDWSTWFYFICLYMYTEDYQNLAVNIRFAAMISTMQMQAVQF